MHYTLPTIIAVILKEWNREMCGLQSLMSLLLFASRVDIVVSVYACVLDLVVCGRTGFANKYASLTGGRQFCTLVTAKCKTTPRE